jgi:hypothetical protein
MSLIGRLFVVFFGFLAACFMAGMIVVVAVLYPEFSDLDTGMIDQSAINVVLGFGFIFLSGFALLPALIVVLITEAFAGWRDRRCGLLSRAHSVRYGHSEVRRHRSSSPRNHDRRGHRGRPDLLDDRRPFRRRLA